MFTIIGRRTSSATRKTHVHRQWPNFDRHPDLAPKLSDVEARFLEASSGRDLSDAPTTGVDYLTHLRCLITTCWSVELHAAIHPDFYRDDETYHRVLHLCCELIEILRAQGPIAIRRIVKQLQARHDLVTPALSSEAPAVEHLIFNAIGWISCLYVPARQVRSISFRVEVQSSGSALKSSIDIDKAARPLDELLRAFGDLLPKKGTAGQDQTQQYFGSRSTKFKVSCLNVSAMKAVANMQIRWVDSISTHLEFDPTVPAISIFKCPSFCKIQQSEDAVLSHILRTLYEDDEKPCQNFNVPNLMAEIILSYSLLFKDDRSARRVYQKHERRRAALKSGREPVVDRYLDELCGREISSSFLGSTGPVRDTYDVEADFPILKDRLQRIQDYMAGIEPNRFMSLWRDRRDLKVWYTIWAVLLLGLVGVVLAVVSLLLTAVQVNLAQKAYDLQLKTQEPSRARSDAL